MDSLLIELRAATGAAHQELDRGADLRRPDLTRAQYAAFLRGSLAAVGPLEAAVARWLGRRDEVDRVTRIRADLSVLGDVPPADVTLAQPAAASEAEAMGIAYVLEGSTLGGQVLAKAVARTLGLQSDALSYLTFRGPRTLERWRAFVVELEAWGSAAAADARRGACVAAHAAFVAYRDAFERAGVFRESP